MTTYKFSELDKRGKSAVLARYGVYQTIKKCEWCDAHPMEGFLIEAHCKRLEQHHCESVGRQTSCMGWRFTEHGERIA